MGKSKKSRSRRRKDNRGGASKPAAGSRLSAEDALSPVALLNSLGSAVATDREAACIALAQLFARDQTEERAIVIRHNGIKLLCQRLADPSGDVRLHACGALQNLTSSGSDVDDVCERVVDCDVIALVRHLISTTDASTSENASATVVAAVSLFGNLCESSPRALGRLTEPLIFNCLSALLNSSVANVVTVTLSLFHIATDQNAEFSQCILQHSDALRLIKTIVTDAGSSTTGVGGSSPIARLHACGTLANAAMDCVPGDIIQVAQMSLTLFTPEMFRSPLPHLTAAALTGAQTTAARSSTYAEREAALGSAAASEDADMEGDDDSGAAVVPSASDIEAKNEAQEAEARREVKAAETDLKAWDQWRDGVAVQILALELIANLTGAAMVRQEEDENDDQESNISEEQQRVSRAVQTVLMDAKLLPLTLQLLEVSTYSMPDSSDPLPEEVLQQLSHLRHRAAGCIDNFFQALPAEQAMLPSPAQLWSGLCTQVDLDLASSRAIGDASVLEALTAAQWSLLRVVSPDLGCLDLNDAHIQGVISLAAPTETADSPGLSAAIRVNAVGMLGVLGQHAPPNTPHSQAMGKAIRQCVTSNDVQLVAEALNSVFDIYGADEHDANFQALGLLPVLTNHALPVLRAAMKLQDGMMGDDNAMVLHNALENLEQFIEYKGGN